VDHNFGEPGQLGIQLFPKPICHQLDRGVFQSGDIVEVRVVELLHNRSHGSTNERMIVKPSGLRIHFALDGNFDSECVAVDAGTLVASRDFGQTLRGFDNKIFGEADLHKRVVIDARATLPSSISHQGARICPCHDLSGMAISPASNNNKKNNG